MSTFTMKSFEDVDSLVWPSFSGDVELVRRLIKQASVEDDIVNERNLSEFTPLLAAARRGHRQIVEILLDNGAEIDLANQYGVTPLLITAGIPASLNCMRILLQRGAMCDRITYTQGSPETPLLRAVKNKNIGAVSSLIDEYKANVNFTFGDGLALVHHLLISAAPLKSIQILIEAGASRFDIDKQSSRGTPLQIAIEQGSLSAVKLFLKKGASVNQISESSGLTPLRIAIINQKVAIMKYILDWGRDIRFETYFNASSILHVLFHQGFQHLPFADTRILDSEGRSLAEWVLHYNLDPRILNYLKEEEEMMRIAASRENILHDPEKRPRYDDDSSTVLSGQFDLYSS